MACTQMGALLYQLRREKGLTQKQLADTNEKLMVEQIEDDWYITSNHPMTKDHYISFVAFATGDKIQIIKQYPEWNLQTRILKRRHGMLLWYCIKDGLFYQLL